MGKDWSKWTSCEPVPMDFMDRGVPKLFPKAHVAMCLVNSEAEVPVNSTFGSGNWTQNVPNIFGEPEDQGVFFPWTNFSCHLFNPWQDIPGRVKLIYHSTFKPMIRNPQLSSMFSYLVVEPPIWKICSSNWIMSPGRRKNKRNHHSPGIQHWPSSPRHMILYCLHGIATRTLGTAIHLGIYTRWVITPISRDISHQWPPISLNKAIYKSSMSRTISSKPPALQQFRCILMDKNPSGSQPDWMKHIYPSKFLR